MKTKPKAIRIPDGNTVVPIGEAPGAAGTASLTGTYPPKAASASIPGQWAVGARAPPRLEPAPKARTA
ncbi:MAG: hypothetical protein P1V21_12210 [Rhizobiaceae bacterium]|nr:hypothetical protein [Rhizobiaceae bacterium]